MNPISLIPASPRTQHPRTRRPSASPPPPPATFHVGDVFRSQEFGNKAIWYFDHAVTDAGGSVADLVIGGHPGLSWELVEENALMVEYADLATGMPWTIAAGAVKGVDGAEVAAESGTLLG